jgi:uncharacterized protein (TIGR00730 family)
VAAKRLGESLAGRGDTIIYGGGRSGLMGAVADAALSSGGSVLGVIPRHLVGREMAHPGLTSLHTVESMHERKARMSELADAFIALPGGVGTWEEVLEQWTWVKLGLHRKPVALLNVSGYFDPLISMIERAVSAGFLSGEDAGLPIVEQEIAPLLDRVTSHQQPTN